MSSLDQPSAHFSCSRRFPYSATVFARCQESSTARVEVLCLDDLNDLVRLPGPIAAGLLCKRIAIGSDSSHLIDDARHLPKTRLQACGCSQGGAAADVAAAFDNQGLGAVVVVDSGALSDQKGPGHVRIALK